MCLVSVIGSEVGARSLHSFTPSQMRLSTDHALRVRSSTTLSPRATPNLQQQQPGSWNCPRQTPPLCPPPPNPSLTRTSLSLAPVCAATAISTGAPTFVSSNHPSPFEVAYFTSPFLPFSPYTRFGSLFSSFFSQPITKDDEG